MGKKVEFLNFLGEKHCLDLKKIAEYIKTRSATQVRSHLQKHLKKIQKKETEKEAKTNE